MKTFNRGKLKKLCQQGRLVMLRSRQFDDTYGGEVTRQEMPCAMRPGDSFQDSLAEGICYLMEHDFKSSSGTAWENGDGTITLSVHSNCCYYLRIVDAPVAVATH